MRFHGDHGETSLFGGARVSKTDVRIGALGDVDELNSAIGLVMASCEGAPDYAELAWMQERLFAMGADLANPTGRRGSDAIVAADVERLTAYLAALRDELPPLRNFVLPRGTPAAVAAHVARSVCRRAERSVCTLDGTDSVNPSVIAYLNRLSDVLFETARRFNVRAGTGNVKWSGAGRPADEST